MFAGLDELRVHNSSCRMQTNEFSQIFSANGTVAMSWQFRKCWIDSAKPNTSLTQACGGPKHHSDILQLSVYNTNQNLRVMPRGFLTRLRPFAQVNLPREPAAYRMQEFRQRFVDCVGGMSTYPRRQAVWTQQRKLPLNLHTIYTLSDIEVFSSCWQQEEAAVKSRPDRI